MVAFTFRDGEICNSLPSVHGHAPAIFDSTTAEVDDEFRAVVVEGFED